MPSRKINQGEEWDSAEKSIDSSRHLELNGLKAIRQAEQKIYKQRALLEASIEKMYLVENV